MGAALTGLGRLLPELLGTIITTSGIVMALIFGAWVGWADFKKLELSREARTAMAIADEALDKAGQYAAAVDEEVRHRNLRDDRLEAGTLMREAIASGVANSLDMGDAIDSMLDSAKQRLVAACGFDAA